MIMSFNLNEILWCDGDKQECKPAVTTGELRKRYELKLFPIKLEEGV